MGGSSLNPVKRVKKALKKTKKTLSSLNSERKRSHSGDPIADIKHAGRKWDAFVSERSPAKKMFDKMTPDMPDMTEPKDPYVAPDPEAVAQSRRRRKRGGASTIMTSGSDSLGG